MYYRMLSVLLAGWAFGAFAQTTPAPAALPTPEEIRAQNERALALTERRAAMLEADLQKLRDQMLRLDESIERRVQELLTELEGIKDSKESKTRIANLKEDVMLTLKNSLDVYRRERDKRIAALNAAYAPVADKDLQTDVDKLKERGEQRVEQIVQLAKTLTKDEGFEKYDYYNDENLLGDTVQRRKNEDWKQNRRESSKTAQDQGKILDALQKNIAELQQQGQRLETSRASAATDEERALLDEQIQANQDTLARRRNQMRELIQAEGGGGRELGRQEAFQLEQLVRDMVESLKKDFRELYRLATERDNARARLRNVQVQAEQIKSDLAMIGSKP
jgi:hypothetical protein